MKEITVGEYFADVLVEDKIIVEIKAAKTLTVEHEAQLLNYLKDVKGKEHDSGKARKIRSMLQINAFEHQI